jgi:hypothetical protein
MTDIFLAPPATEEQQPAPQASDRGEVAMDRLRHPFDVAAGTTAPPAPVTRTPTEQ